MTREEFRRMPLMLTRRQVSAVLGLSSRAISQLVAAGKLSLFVVSRGDSPTRAKYRKSEVAQMAGLDF